MGWSTSRLAASSPGKVSLSGSNRRGRPSWTAILARLTSVQDRWPFRSFRAKRRLVRTASAKSVTCGSGSGRAASVSRRSGMSDSKPRKSLPFGPSRKGAVLVPVLAVEDDDAAVGVLHLDPPPAAAGVGVLLRAVGRRSRPGSCRPCRGDTGPGRGSACPCRPGRRRRSPSSRGTCRGRGGDGRASRARARARSRSRARAGTGSGRA